MTRILDGVDAFRACAGTDLGTSSWLLVEQQRIDGFADITEDWQWIHVDPVRAGASELGRTVAHGYLVLSLIPRLSSEIFRFAGIDRALNYGLDRVRFPTSVHPGDRVRAHARGLEVTNHSTGAVGRVRYTIEVEDRDRPACVADAVILVVT